MISHSTDKLFEAVDITNAQQYFFLLTFKVLDFEQSKRVILVLQRNVFFFLIIAIQKKKYQNQITYILYKFFKMVSEKLSSNFPKIFQTNGNERNYF